MKLSLKWLQTNGACSDGKEWFVNQTKTNSIQVLNSLMTEKKFEWANWTITRLFTHKQKVRYALFAAESVIEIYERTYPNDKRPREAIEAAKRWVRNPTTKNKDAAYAAAYAAANAAYAAYAANAAYAAYAANAAYAAYAAYAANAAANAAYAAYAANAAARERLQIAILAFGIGLLKARKAKRLVKVS